MGTKKSISYIVSLALLLGNIIAIAFANTGIYYVDNITARTGAATVDRISSGCTLNLTNNVDVFGLTVGTVTDLKRQGYLGKGSGGGTISFTVTATESGEYYGHILGETNQAGRDFSIVDSDGKGWATNTAGTSQQVGTCNSNPVYTMTTKEPLFLYEGTNTITITSATNDWAPDFFMLTFSKSETDPQFIKLRSNDFTATANSEEKTSAQNQASKALDGDTSTLWHTGWSDNDILSSADRSTNPYELIVNFGEALENISRLTYTPRQDGSVNGIITKYELLYSEDGAEFTLVAEGSFDCSATNRTPAVITFNPVTTQYVKLVVRDSLPSANYYGSCAELAFSLYNPVDGEIHPLVTAKEGLLTFIESLNEVINTNPSETIKQYMEKKVEEAQALIGSNTTTVEEIERLKIEDEQMDMITALQGRIDTSTANTVYYERLLGYLGDNDFSNEAFDFVSTQLSGFDVLGRDLGNNYIIDFYEEFTMSEDDKGLPLYARLEKAVNNAKDKIQGDESGTYKMLEELCGYVDGTSAFGLDAAACEYLVNNINFALENIEKIEEGEIGPPTTIDSGKLWLDDKGSKISAHGGQIIIGPDNKYYWYGEDNKMGYDTKTGVSCYSSDDLLSWTYEGLAFKAFDHVLNEKYVDELLTDPIMGTKGRIERPKVLYNEKNDNYVMWMHLEKAGGYALSVAGIAVSNDGPAGPFEWLGYGYPVWDKSIVYDGRQKQTFRDMNVMADVDGTGYVIYASEENHTTYVARLNPDYTWIDVDGLEEDIDFVTPNMLTDSSGIHHYEFPSFTSAQMRYNLQTLNNPNGRWSRIMFDNAGSWGGGKIDAQREAPAPIIIEGNYYIISSGCSGWTANRVRADKAPDILGPYESEKVLPGTTAGFADREANDGVETIVTDGLMVGQGDYNSYQGKYSTSATAFDSQSTCILPLPDGSFMYMGDRWKNGDYTDAAGGTGSLIKRSTYVWLPIDFDEDGELMVTWQDSWEIPESGSEFVVLERLVISSDGEKAEFKYRLNEGESKDFDIYAVAYDENHRLLDVIVNEHEGELLLKDAERLLFKIMAWEKEGGSPFAETMIRNIVLIHD